MSIQVAKVREKVQYIGPSRCDVCECYRPECVEIPVGFFGMFSGYICDTCISRMLLMFNRESK